MRFLLDVNILVALAIPDHALHDAAHSWFQREKDRQWATSPFTQAGFVRVCARELGGNREAIRQALAHLEADCRSPQHEFWPADINLLDLTESQRSRLIGMNQIADMQLVLLAHRHRGRLATFDTGIRELAAGTQYADSVLIL